MTSHRPPLSRPINAAVSGSCRYTAANASSIASERVRRRSDTMSGSSSRSRVLIMALPRTDAPTRVRPRLANDVRGDRGPPFGRDAEQLSTPQQRDRVLDGPSRQARALRDLGEARARGAVGHGAALAHEVQIDDERRGPAVVADQIVHERVDDVRVDAEDGRWLCHAEMMLWRPVPKQPMHDLSRRTADPHWEGRLHRPPALPFK